jgi:hypothetical protein
MRYCNTLRGLPLIKIEGLVYGMRALSIIDYGGTKME